MEHFGAQVELTPGRSASFEITQDGELLFSKLESGRFPTDEEIAALLNR